MQIKNKQSVIKMQTRKISKNTTHKKTTSALKKEPRMKNTVLDKVFREANAALSDNRLG